jgi:8-oxo-dGTP diphosphatase
VGDITAPKQERRVSQVAIGILRRDSEILLVEQMWDAPLPVWALPGGAVEPGEIVTEALVREFREETGLTVEEIGPLAYFSEVDDGFERHHGLVFAFEIARWSGSIAIDDPDDLVTRAAFMPIAEALKRIESVPWRAVKEPAAAYLREEAGPGTVWMYRRDPSSPDEHLIGRVDSGI